MHLTSLPNLEELALPSTVNCLKLCNLDTVTFSDQSRLKATLILPVGLLRVQLDNLPNLGNIVNVVKKTDFLKFVKQLNN